MAQDKIRVDDLGGDEVMLNAFLPFQLMEGLLEKLKYLKYEKLYCRPLRHKCLSRVYFAIPTNPGEQFNAFVSLAAWLIGQAGSHMEAPQEYDDPNATITDILEAVSGFGYAAQFPPSKLKSGCGEHCIRVLDSLASAALGHKGIRFEPANFVEKEENDEASSDAPEVHQSEAEDDLTEWTGGNLRLCDGPKVRVDLEGESETEAEVIEGDDDDEAILDLETLQHSTPAGKQGHEESALLEDSAIESLGHFNDFLPTSLHTRSNSNSGRTVLESNTDPADWLMEMEHVLPQLRLAVFGEAKDWRSHLDQMRVHIRDIETSFKETRPHLMRLIDDLNRGMDKIRSREKYMNSQVEPIIAGYRCTQDQLSEVKERYREASGGIAERSQVLAELTDEVERVKSEMNQRGSSMTDSSVVVRIRRAIQRLTAEITAMDIRIGVLEHTLLRAHLRAREETQKPLFTPYTIGECSRQSFEL